MLLADLSHNQTLVANTGIVTGGIVILIIAILLWLFVFDD